MKFAKWYSFKRVRCGVSGRLWLHLGLIAIGINKGRIDRMWIGSNLYVWWDNHRREYRFKRH